jgi:hypothetical protein
MTKKIERINNIKVIKDVENPETPEILAASLIKIGEAMERLQQKGGLDDDAIAALIVNMRGMTGKIGKNDVRLVMDGLARLKSYYIRK